MSNAKSSIWVLACAIGIFTTPLTATADEVVTEVRTTTTSDGAPQVTTTTTTVTGSTVPLSISEAPTILQTVDLRRAELDKLIIDNRTNGTISEGQAASLRRESDRIGAEVSLLKQQVNPSLIRTIAVAQDLDALTTMVKGSGITVVLIPIIEGSHFTASNGRIVQLDDLAVRRIELEKRILAAHAGGRITFDQANHLRSELNAIAALEAAYSTSGILSPKSSREIYRDMDKVANELDRMTD